HQLCLAPRPGRRGQGEQRHGLQEVGLALAVGAEEEVEARIGFELEPRIVPVVAKFEREQPHMATRIGMITYRYSSLPGDVMRPGLSGPSNRNSTLSPGMTASASRT